LGNNKIEELPDMLRHVKKLKKLQVLNIANNDISKDQDYKNKGDDVQWSVYWVLYSFFSLIETFQSFILYWIPFYFAFKLAFLLWAMLPQTRGAKFLYDSFLKDFLKKSSDPMSRIDTAMAEAKKSADTTASELVDNVSDLGKKDE